jgi:aminoglycoside/choline kinase family phosphotransferase
LPKLKCNIECVMQKKIEEKLTRLYTGWSGTAPDRIEPLSAHGSERTYYRIYGAHKSVIGAYNTDRDENRAFLALSKHFHSLDLPVPEIYHHDQEQMTYLIEDLGDQTLFSYLNTRRAVSGFSDEIISLYEKVVTLLPRFQIEGARDIDYNICYPRHSFDKQSMLWDLNYFKYYFLKLANVTFDEQKLEDDFHRFCDYLLQTPCDFFLYRDFQSRNIMIKTDALYFIDYQGGRKGALQYDIASLLYDAKADIPHNIRNYLLEKYLSAVDEYHVTPHGSFMDYYPGYVLIRIMQALGAYGFRGFYQRKLPFLQSIPYAINNLETVLHENVLPVDIDELRDVWTQLTHAPHLRKMGSMPKRLTIAISSFSYKNGLPLEDSEHGGGFIFDCRSLPNPGRFPEYKNFTGMDANVIDFLNRKKEVKRFLENIYRLLDPVITNYQNRNFTRLMVSFGCTGGQHRSVYCAAQLAAYLKTKHPVDIKCHHRELGQS